MREALPLDQVGVDALLLHLLVQEERLLVGGVFGRSGDVRGREEFEVRVEEDGYEGLTGGGGFVLLCSVHESD